MKCISLWQPWASAIAIGVKGIETRGWFTKYRGPIAIHASKRWGHVQKEFAATEHALGRLPKRFPLGAIVATATLVDVRHTIDIVTTISAIERLYGDYGPGRYGWMLADVNPLSEPIPYRGKQGFFEVPDELFAVAA